MTEDNSKTCRYHPQFEERFLNIERRFEQGDRMMETLSSKFDNLKTWVIGTLVSLLASLVVALIVALTRIAPGAGA